MRTKQPAQLWPSTSASERPASPTGSACGFHPVGHHTGILHWLIVLSIGAPFLYVCLRWWLVGVVAFAVLLAFGVSISLFDDYGPGNHH
ncbi:MAG: hypothetical protein RBS72_08085 [Sedimentisphaerales bacterium]|jgi:hypothetical protein|nr:hypothetical protein [Sedimentisphaerales bacterium]NLZ04110.1 hypothetical protein [Phycisphaerae bacterium]HNY78024.1 hypothetical protein [Sedimentisphaerales bacterium]HOC63258.1 hypothetical protein [Sedimentisphaerales bacterium]HOH64199.1 hypothetical protein [Sedimentisphaerales bacterium]